MLEDELNWGLSAARPILRKRDFRDLNPMIFRPRQQSFLGGKREKCGSRRAERGMKRERQGRNAEFGSQSSEWKTVSKPLAETRLRHGRKGGMRMENGSICESFRAGYMAAQLRVP